MVLLQMQAAGRRSRRSVARPPPQRGGVGVAGLADRHGRYLAAAPAPDAENLAYGLARAAANAQQAAGRGAQAVHGQHPASNSSSSTGKPSVICRNNAFPDDPIGRAGESSPWYWRKMMMCFWRKRTKP